MRLKPGSTIPKGYSVSVHTWENDLDNFDTTVLHGLDKEMANDLVKFCSHFSHAADGKVVESYGNHEISATTLIEVLLSLHHAGVIRAEFLERFFALQDVPAADCTDDEYYEFVSIVDDAEGEGYELIDNLHNILGTPVDYEFEFARMVSNVTVYHFEEDFVVPALPEPLHKFDGSYQARHLGIDHWKV